MERLFTVHMMCSKAIDATKEERSPYIKKNGKRTMKKEKAVTFDTLKEAESFMKENNIASHQGGAAELK